MVELNYIFMFFVELNSTKLNPAQLNLKRLGLCYLS